MVFVKFILKICWSFDLFCWLFSFHTNLRIFKSLAFVVGSFKSGLLKHFQLTNKHLFCLHDMLKKKIKSIQNFNLNKTLSFLPKIFSLHDSNTDSSFPTLPTVPQKRSSIFVPFYKHTLDGGGERWGRRAPHLKFATMPASEWCTFSNCPNSGPPISGSKFTSQIPEAP